VPQLVAAFVIIALLLSFATFIAIFAVICAALFGIGYFIYWYYQREKAAAEHAAALERLRQETLRLHNEASRQLPSVDEFVDLVTEAIPEVCKGLKLAPCPRQLSQQFGTMAAEIYCRDLPALPPAIPDFATPHEERAFQAGLVRLADRAQKFDAKLIATAVAQSIAALLQHMPKQGNEQFRIPLAQLVDLPSLTWGLIDPFRKPELFSRGLCLSLWETFHQNAVTAGGGNAPVYPQDFKSDWPALKVADLYLKNTPFQPLLKTCVPWGVTDEQRFQHQWVLGSTGSGKTTYLTNLISADFDRVAKGECSIFVLDSQLALSQLAKCKVFAPGEPLHGKLVLIEPNARHPLALNPFHIGRARYAADDERQINATVDLLTYAFGSIFEADLSTLQSGAARYIIRLMLEIPGATIETLTDFLTGRNYLKPEYQHCVAKLRGPAKSYFENRFEHLRPDTKSGILDRLYMLREHSAIDAMFCASECKLDLYSEMQAGRIIVVNADKDYLTQDRTEMFGRFFIAMLLQAAQQRAPLRDAEKLPVFCYIDEAHDYIRKDPRVPVLIDQVRKQKVAMTFAHHRESQIEDKNVLSALQHTYIRTRCVDRGSATVTIGPIERAKTYFVPVEDFSFPRAPHMSAQEWRQVQQEMRARYCIGESVAVEAPPVAAEDATAEY
jgi:hypothetical protein